MGVNYRTLTVACVMTLVGCGERGDAGAGFTLRDARVAISNGYRRGECTYVVVRDWPLTTTDDERAKDQRLTIGTGGMPIVRGPDGPINPWQQAPRAYVFEGQKLTSFPIRMIVT